MFTALEKIVSRLYFLEAVRIYYHTDNTYVVQSSHQLYLLKRLHEVDEKMILLNSPYFVNVIPSRIGMNDFIYQNEHYYLMPFLKVEAKTPADLPSFLKQLAFMHKNTFYVHHVSRDFYAYEVKCLEARLKETYQYFDDLMDGLLEDSPLHPAMWLMINVYPQILEMKELAFRFLNKYQTICESKDTCRMCLSLKTVSFNHFCSESNCFIPSDQAIFCRVPKNLLELFYLDVEVENIQKFYLDHFMLNEEEKYWLLLHLLCFETIDLFQDAYQSIIYFHHLAHRFTLFNKILNSLQIVD